MRCIILLISALIGMLHSSRALMDVGYRTDVAVWTKTWDQGVISTECCTSSFPFEYSPVEDLCWLCTNDLEDENCKMFFSFAEPQDITLVRLIPCGDDLSVGAIKMTFYDINGDSITIIVNFSGETFYQERVNTDATIDIVMELVGLEDEGWLGIQKVQFLVD